MATEAPKDYIGGMKGAARLPFAVFLTSAVVLAVPFALGSDVAAGPAGPAGPAPSPSPPPSAQRLKLGPYVDPYGPVTAERLLDVPRFETRVEVLGKAMDSAALTAKMEWWMRDFEPIRGAVSHQGSAPSVEEMREYRPGVTPGANIVPILEWLADKLNKKP